MKKLAVGVIAIVAITAAIGWTLGRRPADAGASAVQVERVARRSLATVVKATGVVKPMLGAEVKVGARISGVLRRLFVRVGDRVRPGQRLAEIDDRELAAREREAAAALALARANQDFTTSDLRRKRALTAEQLLPPSDLDLAERAQAIAEQQVAQANATLDYTRTQLAYAQIDAPIAGVVASVSTQEGETVAASFAAPTFVTLLDLTRLEVWAYVDETDIGRVRVGQRARFTVDTYGKQEFAGEVSEIHPQAEIRDNVVDYVVVVRFRPSAERPLRPEMTTSVHIAIEEKDDVLAIPLKAVHRDGERAFVWRRHDARLERVPVSLGTRDDSHWELTGGLREGDEVVVGDLPTSGEDRDD